MDKPTIEQSVRNILAAIGEDPDREGLRGTPRRIADMYEEIFSGLHEDPSELLAVGFDDEDHHEMVVVKDIPFHSMCEHHLLPFHGLAHVGYIPQGRILGISKVARLVEILARRPQVQERLTSQVADFLCEAGLRALGAAVVIEAEHLCYDRETEILTPGGWVRFDELSPRTQVAQVEPETLGMSWAFPREIVRYPYQGPMIHWKNDTVDLLVTPDHRMLFQREWAFERHHGQPWEIAPAWTLPGRFYVPQAVVWSGPDVQGAPLGDVVISGDDYARFMGAWLSEGCTRRHPRDVVISQDEGDFSRRIWDTVERLPFTFRRVPQAGRRHHLHFISRNRGLYEDLRRLGKSGDKFIPASVKMMSSRQIRIFLDWYAAGDGSRSWRNPLRVQYVSKSHQLVDDLQELMLRVGMTGSPQRYAECSRIETRTHKRADGKGYKWYGKLRPHHRRVVWLHDEVFCVSVPSGAILVRRNGRPIVSGNCVTMRGVRKPGSRVVTSATRGIFREDPRSRAEFISIDDGHR